MRQIAFCSLLVAALALGACAKRSASGIYTYSNETATALVQLVQVDKGYVSGRLEWVSLKPDGKLADNNASLTGLSDGNTISLSLKSAAVLVPAAQGTASLAGDELTLSLAGLAGTVELHRSTLADFEKHAGALRERSAKLLAAQAAAYEAQRQQQELAELNARETQASAAQFANQQAVASTLASTAGNLASALDAFAARLDRVQARSIAVEKEFQTLSSRLAILRERRRNVSSDRAGQVDGATASLQARSEKLHIWVTQGIQQLSSDEEAIRTSIGRVTIACAGTANPSTPQQIEAQKACTLLQPRTRTFAQKEEQTRQAFVRVESAYRSTLQGT